MKNRIVFIALVILFILPNFIPAPVWAQSVGDGPFDPGGIWTDEFKAAGPNGTVTAIAYDTQTGAIYVGGNFTLPAKNIAKWNGTSWEPLGEGVDGWVKDMVIDSHGNLYAAGTFEKAGGLYVNYVALWDGKTWQALKDSERYAGVNAYYPGSAEALAIDSQDRLYIAGEFTRAGYAQVKNLAMWDGAWHAVGNATFNKPIKALAIDSHDHLYVGGTFSSCSAPGAKALAKWDGTSWSALGSGVTSNNSYNLSIVGRKCTRDIHPHCSRDIRQRCTTSAGKCKIKRVEC